MGVGQKNMSNYTALGRLISMKLVAISRHKRTQRDNGKLERPRTKTDAGEPRGPTRQPRSRLLNKSEPQPEVRLPDPPSQLLDVAVSLWEHGVAN